MSTAGLRHPSLHEAMLRYVDARTASIVEARRELRINELDARAVLFIGAHPGTRPGTLSAFLGVTSAGVTTLIDRLVDRRVVRRDVDPNDRRVNRITVTVDLGEAPWSALTRFDDAFSRAAGAGDPDSTLRLAHALVAYTDAATAATALPRPRSQG
ncbi:MarR family winged helix-turn-helix transcriptional regulator [Microbacterium sp. NPDC019599]|uniref:MarR family winged helix-turn-helix transcriptional regulator n=1 Tax=Microbacterium sp. NPDC019599 TaxID=3154690 RepID=UPI0033D56633